MVAKEVDLARNRKLVKPFGGGLMRKPFALALFVLAAFPAWTEAPNEDLPLVYEENFATGGLERWEFADPKVWKRGEEDGDGFLSTYEDSDYKPIVRSPQNIAWLRNFAVSDFVLDATVRSTQEEYGHRDVCFLFGRKDATHYYYVHIATKADEHANSIFLVDGSPRVSIAKERTDGTKWSEGWRHVRIVRDSESGEIEVYFEDMENPIMQAVDKTFSAGSIGFGAFDDTADLTEIVIRGK